MANETTSIATLSNKHGRPVVSVQLGRTTFDWENGSLKRHLFIDCPLWAHSYEACEKLDGQASQPLPTRSHKGGVFLGNAIPSYAHISLFQPKTRSWLQTLWIIQKGMRPHLRKRELFGRRLHITPKQRRSVIEAGAILLSCCQPLVGG